jgi:hypothetical protein
VEEEEEEEEGVAAQARLQGRTHLMGAIWRELWCRQPGTSASARRAALVRVWMLARTKTWRTKVRTVGGRRLRRQRKDWCKMSRTSVRARFSRCCRAVVCLFPFLNPKP